MDTTTGRFISMDSYLGSVDDPVSLHKYLYANANPVNYIDPSGYNSYGEMNLALKIQLILTDITTLKINMYCWYIRLGEASIGGKILKEVIDESFELLLEGDVDIYSIMWTSVEIVYGLADSEQEFSTLKKTTKSGSYSTNKKIIPPSQVNGGTFGVEVPPAHFIGDSPVAGSHNATIKVIDKDGNITKVWREVSGNATASEKALGTGRMRQATHTEQRALTRINLTDETVLITGQQAPCRNCQGAMRKATSNNSATIIYQWRERGQTYQVKWKGNKKIK